MTREASRWVALKRSKRAIRAANKTFMRILEATVILKWSGNLLELNIAPRKLNISVKALFKDSGHVVGNQRDGFVHARLVLKKFTEI